MATFIVLMNWTEQGVKNVKDSPNRLDAAKALAKKLGGEVKAFYMTVGTYDGAVIVEFPNDEAMARFALLTGQAGSIRTTTLKAFPEGDYRKIIASL